MTHPSAPHLETLVARCVERIEDGDTGDRAALVSTVCAEHPELRADVRARLDQLAALGLLADQRTSDCVPERLGGFRLLRHLGGGGMGEVYLAREESLGRDVALKLIRPELLYAPDARARFAREAHTVAQLSHPGLVPVHASGEEGGIPWLAMELVRGATLEAVLASLAGRDPASLDAADLRRAVMAATPAFDELPADSSASDTSARELFDGSWSDACLRVVAAVADCLQHAHEHGVLHRDVKPANIMLDAAGRVRLLDFGVAARADAGKLTRTGAQIGSLVYMAPEQVRGELSGLDARVDVYGLGVTLHELLTLRPAFEAESLDALRTRILDGTAGAIRPRNPSVSRDVETLTGVAMEVDAARRYPSAAALAADARAALRGEPVVARPPNAWERAWRRARRRPALSAALALTALLVVGGPLAYAEIARRHADDLADALQLARDERSAAQTARDVADDQRLRADAQAALALQRLDEAEAARRRAETNLDLARASVERALVALADDTLLESPGLEQARGRLREDAVELYTLIVAQQPDDQPARVARLQVVEDLGYLLLDQGRNDHALEIWHELEQGAATELAGGQLDADQVERLERFHLSGLLGVATAQELLGEPLASRDSFDATIAAARAIHARRPDDTEVRRTLATALRSRARWYEARVQQLDDRAARESRDVALAAYEEALTVLDGLGADLGQTASLVTERAGLVQNFAILLNSLGEPMRQLELCLDTLESIDALPASERESRALRITRPAIQARLANALAALGEVHEAETQYAAALRGMDAVADQHPRLLRVHTARVATRFEIGAWRYGRGDLAGSRAVLERAFADLDAATAAGVTSVDLETARVSINLQLAHALRDLGELQASADTYRAALAAADAVYFKLVTVQSMPVRHITLLGLANVELRQGRVRAAAATARRLETEIEGIIESVEDAGLLLSRCAAEPLDDWDPREADAFRAACLDDAFRLLHMRLDRQLDGLDVLQSYWGYAAMRDDPRWSGVLARFEPAP